MLFKFKTTPRIFFQFIGLQIIYFNQNSYEPWSLHFLYTIICLQPLCLDSALFLIFMVQPLQNIYGLCDQQNAVVVLKTLFALDLGKTGVKINNSKAIFYHVDAKIKLSALSLILQPKKVSNNHVSMFYKYPILNKLSLGSMFSVYPIALNIN